MSTHPPNHGHAEPGHGEHGGEDDIDFGKVIAVGVVSLVIFAVATYWAATILRRETARIEDRSGPVRQGKVGLPEIGIVDQVPFASDSRLEGWQKERAARLNGYGWVDRVKGIAHVPIEGAMDAVAGGTMPAGAPQ
jgi:hypothetical protein